jgi:hypothetical protein
MHRPVMSDQTYIMSFSEGASFRTGVVLATMGVLTAKKQRSEVNPFRRDPFVVCHATSRGRPVMDRDVKRRWCHAI